MNTDFTKQPVQRHDVTIDPVNENGSFHVHCSCKYSERVWTSERARGKALHHLAMAVARGEVVAG